MKKLKDELLDKWRPIIFYRDGNKCRFCSNTEKLQLAHINACANFIKEAVEGGETAESGIRKSFFKNNLITLCNSCHYTHHIYVDGDRGSLTKKRLKKARKINNMMERNAQIKIKPRYDRFRHLPKSDDVDRSRQHVYLKKLANKKLTTEQIKKLDIKIVESDEYDTRELLFGRKKCKEGFFRGY